jgi:antirestriction protein ArdC
MSIYQTVTDRILKQLEHGVIPWRKTWTTGLPKSLTTGRDYRGVNILVLAAAEFTSRYWVTYREAQRLGGYVRRGERATPVVYWKWRTPEELARIALKTGREEPAPCVPFVAAVFNLDQVEGIARPADDVPSRGGPRLDEAERLVAAMPARPEIVYGASLEPAYNRGTDQVTMPHPGQFESGGEHFAALYHELTHSTGAAHRLNRFAQAEGDRGDRYAFEELVAEIGAAFLCAATGISHPVTEALQASYIAGWSAALRQDHRLVLRAASAAQRAVDFIRGTRHPEPVATDD